MSKRLYINKYSLEMVCPQGLSRPVAPCLMLRNYSYNNNKFSNSNNIRRSLSKHIALPLLVPPSCLRPRLRVARWPSIPKCSSSSIWRTINDIWRTINNIWRTINNLDPPLPPPRMRNFLPVRYRFLCTHSPSLSLSNDLPPPILDERAHPGRHICLLHAVQPLRTIHTPCQPLLQSERPHLDRTINSITLRNTLQHRNLAIPIFNVSCHFKV